MGEPTACKMWTDRLMQLVVDYNCADNSTQLHVDNLPTYNYNHQKPYNTDGTVNCNYINQITGFAVTGPCRYQREHDAHWNHYYSTVSSQAGEAPFAHDADIFDISGDDDGSNNRTSGTQTDTTGPRFAQYF